MENHANIHRTDGGSVTDALPQRPARYQLISKNGIPHGYGTKGDLIDLAHSLWPGQHQDDSANHEEPNGWDLQACE